MVSSLLKSSLSYLSEKWGEPHLAYEVFAGNRADVTTVEDIVDLTEKKYGCAKRIWAMDRGMV